MIHHGRHAHDPFCDPTCDPMSEAVSGLRWPGPDGTTLNGGQDMVKDVSKS